MSLTIDDDRDSPLWIDCKDLTSDPTNATVTLKITVNGVNVTGSPFACTWSGAATQTGTTWARSANTNAGFLGSAQTASGSDVKLAPGVYRMQPLLAASGQTLPLTEETLYVN